MLCVCALANGAHNITMLFLSNKSRVHLLVGRRQSCPLQTPSAKKNWCIIRVLYWFWYHHHQVNKSTCGGFKFSREEPAKTPCCNYKIELAQKLIYYCIGSCLLNLFLIVYYIRLLPSSSRSYLNNKQEESQNNVGVLKRIPQSCIIYRFLTFPLFS